MMSNCVQAYQTAISEAFSNRTDFHAWGQVMFLSGYEKKSDYAVALEHTWTNVRGAKDDKIVVIFEEMLLSRQTKNKRIAERGISYSASL